ncbi:TPA: hypothetical protein P0E23_000737 [Vibrio harveyi]|nr:hypothetical protein [Vibrio harveyi]HDM8168150.1 hypothetical protein [Vibrio harveyi]
MIKISDCHITNMDFSNVIYVESLYALSLIFFEFKDHIDDSLFVIRKNSIDISIINGLDNYVVFEGYLSNLDKVKIRFFGQCKKTEKINFLIQRKFRYIGHDHLNLSCFFYFNSQDVVIIEDGLQSYKLQSKPSIVKRALYFTGVYFKPFGRGEKVNKVILTGKGNVPLDLKNKVKIIDYTRYLRELPVIQNGSFSCELECEDDNVVILLTQPLSEDGILTECEKIKIYSTIVEGLNNKVLIKPHPREKTVYSNYGFSVLKNNFLIESIYFNSNISTIISLFSTATMDGPECCSGKLITLGTGFNTKLIDKFGVVESSSNKYEEIIKKLGLIY